MGKVKSLGIDRLGIAVPSLTLAQRADLDVRIADHRANPNDVVPWSEVKAEAEARFRR